MEDKIENTISAMKNDTEELKMDISDVCANVKTEISAFQGQNKHKIKEFCSDDHMLFLGRGECLF
jgi:hypothetical protein